MPDLTDGLHYAVEVVKLIGAFASFYAVIKLRQIERKYLLKATIPELIESLDKALSVLSLALAVPSGDQAEVAKALNHLIADAKNIKRKSQGDTLLACRQLLEMIHATRPRRYFWQAQAPMDLSKEMLLEIYGKGSGLAHSLENDLRDQGWTGK